ncbi:MAG: hypothetical protein HQ463_06965 [Bacteroidetes bacterium]|nr:hypothetical protein [Bacteroidota bacterium]
MDTAKIKIDINANAKLHGYNLKLVRIADNVTVMTKSTEVHQNDYIINETWVNNNTIHSDMFLTVDAIKSHDGTKITKTVQFHAHKP